MFSMTMSGNLSSAGILDCCCDADDDAVERLPPLLSTFLILTTLGETGGACLLFTAGVGDIDEDEVFATWLPPSLLLATAALSSTCCFLPLVRILAWFLLLHSFQPVCMYVVSYRYVGMYVSYCAYAISVVDPTWAAKRRVSSFMYCSYVYLTQHASGDGLLIDVCM